MDTETVPIWQVLVLNISIYGSSYFLSFIKCMRAPNETGINMTCEKAHLELHKFRTRC